MLQGGDSGPVVVAGQPEKSLLIQAVRYQNEQLHMPPPGKLPEQFGNGEADFPEDFWGQLVYPFRKKRKAADAEPERKAA